MKKILTNPYCFPSARLLRDELEKNSGLKLLVTTNPAKIKSGDLFLRYGNSGHTDDAFNSPEFIHLASNKLSFSRLCLENEIYSPEFKQDKPSAYPVIIRSTLHGKHAEGITVVENEEVFNNLWRVHYYWTPFVNLKSEFRVHVAFGNILKVFKKVDVDPNVKFPIRISDNCHFSLVKTLPKLEELVTKLNGILGIDCFYGLDCGWDDRNKKYFILEVNSAPGLNELTACLYSQAILVKKGLINNEVHRTDEDNQGA